jgi:hypothetical protein
MTKTVYINNKEIIKLYTDIMVNEINAMTWWMSHWFIQGDGWGWWSRRLCGTEAGWIALKK